MSLSTSIQDYDSGHVPPGHVLPAGWPLIHDSQALLDGLLWPTEKPESSF